MGVTVATELASVSVGVSISRTACSTPWSFTLAGLVSTLVLLAPVRADAGRVMDYIRNTDLNDYALGLAYSVGQSPYVATDGSTIVYPYLTSFEHLSLIHI